MAKLHNQSRYKRLFRSARTKNLVHDYAMNVIHTGVLFVGLSFCLAFVPISKSLFNKISLRFFLAYLFLEAINFTFEWLMVHPSTPYKATWLASMMASSFLMAPCVWLFAQEVSQNKPPLLRSVSWIQILVVFAGVSLTLPLFLASHSGSSLIAPPASRTILSTYIHITMILSVTLYLVQVPWYLAKCLTLFKQKIQVNKLLFSSIEEPGLNALKVLIWVMVANWILGLARTLRVMIFSPSEFWDVFFSVCEVTITLVALYAIFKRCWEYNQEDQQLLSSLAPEDLKTNLPSEHKKYAKSALDAATRNRIQTKINIQFETQKIHLQNNLTLQNLCAVMKENPHYVSQVINQDLQLSFYDLVNRYRIQDAKEQLQKLPAKTILAIALDVGFNSKSTFNKAFKVETGCTPSTYRQQCTP